MNRCEMEVNHRQGLPEIRYNVPQEEIVKKFPASNEKCPCCNTVIQKKNSVTGIKYFWCWKCDYTKVVQ